ncbi:putative leader peptide [Frankia sp. Cppng1_Ct_nod]|uniref:putative leader peptide n=1 Tax=Frankia sp. Cppng1_Ct_nod TaxID=2897162 RepID=UPI0032EA0BFB
MGSDQSRPKRPGSGRVPWLEADFAEFDRVHNMRAAGIIKSVIDRILTSRRHIDLLRVSSAAC